MTRSALSSGTPEVERSGEKDRAVWIFCKGQCNFIIIQRVHTLSHTQRIMYAEMCLDLCTRPPTCTCSSAGVWVQRTQACFGNARPAPCTYTPCCHFRHVITPRQTHRLVQTPRETEQPTPLPRHLKDGKVPLGDPSAQHPKPFISGLPWLLIAGHDSCSFSNIFPVGERNEP